MLTRRMIERVRCICRNEVREGRTGASVFALEVHGVAGEERSRVAFRVPGASVGALFFGRLHEAMRVRGRSGDFGSCMRGQHGW